MSATVVVVKVEGCGSGSSSESVCISDPTAKIDFSSSEPGTVFASASFTASTYAERAVWSVMGSGLCGGGERSQLEQRENSAQVSLHTSHYTKT